MIINKVFRYSRMISCWKVLVCKIHQRCPTKGLRTV